MRILFLCLLGMLTAIQSGQAQCLSGACDNGIGTYHFRDGSIYEGAFKNGLPDGEGVWQYPKGSKVKGLFKNGLPVGNDAFAQAPKTKRKTGCVSGNCRNGIGVYLDQEGNRYVGYFKRNKPSGKGICYYPNGSRYDGNWRAGLPNGEGVLHDVSGQLFHGYWDNGSLNSTIKTPKIIEEHAILDVPQQKLYAVVIGIANYEKMDVLDYSDDDAYNFYSFLESKNSRNENVRFLVDENATAANIKAAIEDVAERAGANDKIVIYYSGHGVEKAIIPFESDGQNDLLPHQEISSILQKSAAASKTLYIDACNTEKPEANIQQDMNFDGLTVFYSSSPGGESREYNELQQGVFSYFLIDGLKGAADADGDNHITTAELYNYVFINVNNYTETEQYPWLVVGAD